MCWAVPAVVLEVREDGTALLDLGDGILRQAVIAIERERVKPGALVMVHAGSIITTVDLSTLKETYKMKAEMARELAELAGEDPDEAEREIWREYEHIVSLVRRSLGRDEGGDGEAQER